MKRLFRITCPHSLGAIDTPLGEITFQARLLEEWDAGLGETDVYKWKPAHFAKKLKNRTFVRGRLNVRNSIVYQSVLVLSRAKLLSFPITAIRR